MTSEAQFERQANKAADAVNNQSSMEAAQVLSQEFLPLHTRKEYDKLADMVAHDTQRSAGMNSFDNDKGNARLFSADSSNPDYLFPKPGQNLSKICKNDFKYEAKPGVTQKDINSCVAKYADANELVDADKIQAGKPLIIPQNIW